MISFLLETSFWIIGKTLTTTYRLVMGQPTDPLLTRLKTIEDKLHNIVLDASGNSKYYWENKLKGNYKDGNWVVISEGKTIAEVARKEDALSVVVEQLKRDTPQIPLQTTLASSALTLFSSSRSSNSHRETAKKFLIVHVGNESEMHEI